MHEQAYTVVKNQEEQYSIWPANLALPLGWEALAINSSKEACLAYIAEHWTDMRPLSLR
ncbi:antibiotic synthesis protein MbtH [Pseudomonas caspiana]|nr:MbtH family NRPS accessory protein [Pseudomonas caspiana]TPG90030.1 antibiotic synthesis protein MbtH [Pseudomonas caspiana]